MPFIFEGTEAILAALALKNLGLVEAGRVRWLEKVEALRRTVDRGVSCWKDIYVWKGV
jgi:hypothetical protein